MQGGKPPYRRPSRGYRSFRPISTAGEIFLDQAAMIERGCWIAAVVFLIGFTVFRAPCLTFLVLWITLGIVASMRVTSTAYGSARLAVRRDLKRAGLLGESGLILGRVQPKRANPWGALVQLFTSPWHKSREVCRYIRAAVLLRYELRTPLIRLTDFVHLMTVAPPGAGKGVSGVIPNMLTYPGSILCIDPKGELYRATADIRERRHRNRVVLFDPLGVCGSVGSRFNPLDFIDPKSPLVADMCAALAESLVVQTGLEADPHWNASAMLAIQAITLYVVVYADPEDRNLNAVADMMNVETFTGAVTMMRDLSGDLAAVHGHTPAYRLLQKFGNAISSWVERELASILSSCSRHLSWLHSPQVEWHLSASDFDPRDLVRSNTTVYLVLPPKYLSTLSRLLRLWITSIYGTITESGAQENRKVLFILDEIGNLGPLPSVYQAITLGRGYGVRVWLFVQSLSQLKLIFPKDGEYQAVEGAIDHKIFFGIKDYATAETLSNYLGQATVGVTSRSTSSGSSQSGSFLGTLLGHANGNDHFTKSTNQGSSKTESEIQRKLLFPDEILQLPADAVLILARGVPPIRGTLAKYYEAPELAHLMSDIGVMK